MKNQINGAAGIRAWIDGVKPEHRLLAKRLDALIAKTIPGVRRAIKWRKPSQPLGVPFYGLWIGQSGPIARVQQVVLVVRDAVSLLLRRCQPDRHVLWQPLYALPGEERPCRGALRRD